MWGACESKDSDTSFIKLPVKKRYKSGLGGSTNRYRSHIADWVLAYVLCVYIYCGYYITGKSSTNIEHHLKKLGYVYAVKKKPQKRGRHLHAILVTR